MLNLKLKLPLLALSISTALVAPQIVSAEPIRILALGDSITNGLLNEGNDDANGNITPGTKLSYRDDLYDLLKAEGVEFNYLGSCPSSTDADGSCNAIKPKHDGKILKHEGRAGYHANDVADELNSWFSAQGTDFPDVALIHIGTNDIFSKSTASSTRDDIKDIIDKLLAMFDGMEIYLAKILPMGENSDGPVGSDAATELNNLLNTAWVNENWPGKKIKIVDMNSGINLDNEHFTTDLVHPRQKTEVIMAKRWFDAMYKGADPATSKMSATPAAITANDVDFATVTFQAKASDNALITTGGDTVLFYNSALTFSEVLDKNNGTYTTTVKRTSGTGGVVTVRAKLNGVKITDTVKITFLAGQKIAFTPPTSLSFGEEKTLKATSQKFTSTTSTDLGVTITVKATSASVCKIDASKKLTLQSVGDCTLIAEQAGNNVYGAATPVEKTIDVIKADQTITFTDTPPSPAFIGDTFSASATSTSSLPVSISLDTPKICSLDSSNKVTILKANGTPCKLTATQGGNDNYKAAIPKVHSIAISADSITFPSIADKTMGDVPFNVTAKAASGNAVTLTSLNTSVCTVKGNKVTLVASGPCTLKAKAGDISATKEFTVKKKNASQLATDTVAKVISGSGSITVAQLEPIKGLKNLEKGRDYTKAIKAGTYADKNNPTVEELQKAVDKANSDANKSGGSTSPLWLLTLGFVALRRKLSDRKQQS